MSGGKGRWSSSFDSAVRRRRGRWSLAGGVIAVSLVAGVAALASQTGPPKANLATQPGAVSSSSKQGVKEDSLDGGVLKDSSSSTPDDGTDGIGNDSDDSGDGSDGFGSPDASASPDANGPYTGSSPGAGRASPGTRSGAPSPGGNGKNGGTQSSATSVPCDTDALIEALIMANANNGGTLTLTRQCTYTLTANQDGNGLPLIQQPITIVGNNAVIVRPPSAAGFRVFTVDVGGNLTLQDLTVAGGNDLSAVAGGGGIWVKRGGTSNLIRTTLSHNSSQTRGGGIFNEGSTTVTDSTITDGAALDGAAINNAGFLTLDGTKLLDSNARGNGAGIYNTGTAVVKYSTLSHNSATGQGGAFYESSLGTATVSNSTLNDNRAVVTGGAVTNEGTFTLTDSKVTYNSATGSGGAFFNDKQLVVQNSKITSNITQANGGALFNSTADASAVLRHDEITANRALGATSQAGGVFNSAGSVALTMTRVSDNSSTIGPGGFFTTNALVTLDNVSLIIGNRPTNSVGSIVAVPHTFG